MLPRGASCLSFHIYAMLYSLYVFLVSLILSIALVPICIRVAFRLNFLDRPDGNLKVQKVATPYLGGAALWASTVLALFLCGLRIPFYLLVPLSCLMIIGLIDDYFHIKPITKFVGQAFATLFFLLASPLPLCFHSPLYFKIFFCIVAIGWILTVINAFNLIDVMDGLAASLGLTASIACWSVAIVLGKPIEISIMAAFSGALVGFLWFNKPLARIYLGDAGSLLIGGVIGMVSFALFSDLSLAHYSVPISILYIPLVEVASLMIIRTYLGRPFYYGSPHHFSHFLRFKEWSIQHILLLSSLFATAMSLVSMLFVLKAIQFNVMIANLFLLAIGWLFFVFNGVDIGNIKIKLNSAFLVLLFTVFATSATYILIKALVL